MNSILKDYVQDLLAKESRNRSFTANREGGEAFAPANIALCKYWGKRDALWNLPETNSLSISLGRFGAKTKIQISDPNDDQPLTQDRVILNGKHLSCDDPFVQRARAFLNLFRPHSDVHYLLESEMNIPVAAGLASSACGFAALVLALNKLYAFDLDLKHLSILARLGSGSACRSLWPGFVEWQKGILADGSDSHGTPLDVGWTSLRLGLMIVNQTPKSISSRLAMERTRATSFFFDAWKTQVEHDLETLKTAIQRQDFVSFGECVEQNAQALHGLMMTAAPSIVYTSPETIALWNAVRQARSSGLKVYFTQDAGPNLKLLFLKEDEKQVKEAFPELWVVEPGT